MEYAEAYPASSFAPPPGCTYGLVLAKVLTFNRRMPDVPPQTAADGRSLNDLVVAVARDRDRTAFSALFGYFAPRLKGYLMRLGVNGTQADELVQEVMLMVWRRAETFDPDQSSASTWIFTIARNKRIDGIRRERRPEFDPEDPVLVPDAPEAADKAIETTQETARLRLAIARLPAEQGELLRMAYFEDKPHSLIAEQQGLPLGTVKSRLRLAMVRLRKEMMDLP
jgi:RNA polymerase sigma-70 factor (ECF subfamily)